nr:tetratricopeptide repeat protein [uncultured Undibacterium sp.]
MKINSSQLPTLSQIISSLFILIASSENVLAAPQNQDQQIPYAKPVKSRSNVKPAATSQHHAQEDVSSQETAGQSATGLSKDILYKLTASDIALQRGEWQAPFVTIMSLAQQTRDPRLAKRAVEIAMSAQQIDESMAAVRLWRELDTNSQEADQTYVSLMVIKNDYPALEKFFLGLLKTSSTESRSDLIYQAQRSLSRTREQKTALLSLEKILVDDATTMPGHIALSRAAYRSGDIERAQQEAKAALALDPSSELGILTLAHATEKTAAFAMIANFLKQYPQAKEVRLAYATMLVESKQLELAKNEFLGFLQAPDQSSLSLNQILYTLGSIEMEMGQLDAAENYFKELISKLSSEDDASSAYISMAQIALQRKDRQTADLWLSKVPFDDGKNPAWFNIQMRRALLLASDKKFLEARQFLQAITASKDTEQAQLLQTEAQIMRDAGQTTEAFVLLQMALGEFPQSTDLIYDYAMLAESLKFYPEMEMALKQLIQMAPSNAFAYNALGYSYADRNLQLDEALTLIEAANQLSPNDPYILDSLGWVKYRLKQYPDAEQFLRRSLSMRQDADVSVHLAEVLWAQSKKDEAMQLFTAAHKKDPQNSLLKNTLQRLELTLP